MASKNRLILQKIEIFRFFCPSIGYDSRLISGEHENYLNIIELNAFSMIAPISNGLIFSGLNKCLVQLNNTNLENIYLGDHGGIVRMFNETELSFKNFKCINITGTISVVLFLKFLKCGSLFYLDSYNTIVLKNVTMKDFNVYLQGSVSIF